MGKNDSYTQTTTPGALYPISNISNSDLEPYKTYLDDSINDENIFNLAISAPYGGGKTSILKSYFKNNYDENKYKKYKFITLTKFFDKDNDESEEALQEKIIEQLLYSSSPKELPYSKISRINDKTFMKEMVEFIFLLLTILPIVFIIEILKDSSFLPKGRLLKAGLIITICIIVFLGGAYFYRKLKIKFSNSTIDVKSNFINVSTYSNKKDDELKTFSKYSEELLYYFRATKTRFIIFEDLDRFNDSKIFQSLRELNENINKHFYEKKEKKNSDKNKSKVMFIYSLKDSVFESKDEKGKPETYDNNDERSGPLFSVNEKAKFFDYIIPVFPNTDLHNSNRLFIKEFEHHDAKFYNDKVVNSKEFRALLLDIGYFVNDLRIIKLIVQEFFVYKKNIEKYKNKYSLNLSDDYYKLFAMIIYKNFNPNDFEKINFNNSNLNIIFNHLSLMLDTVNNEKFKKIDKSISGLKEEKENIYNFIEIDLGTLLEMEFNKQLKKHKASYFIANGRSYSNSDYEVFYNDIVIFNKSETEVYTNRSSSRTIGTVSSFFYSSDVERDLTPIIKAFNNECKFPSTRINEINREISVLTSEQNKLKYNSSDFTSGEIIDAYLNARKESKNIDEVNQVFNSMSEINKMLLINDYISDDFIQYISPVQFSSDKADADFIRKVINRYRFTNDQRVNNPKYILKVFQDREIHQSYLYSSDIVCLNIDNGLRDLILSNVAENYDYEFVYNVYSKDSLDKNIFNKISHYLLLNRNDFYREFLIKYSSNFSFLINTFDKEYVSLSLHKDSIKDSLIKLFSNISDNKVLYNIYFFLSKSQNLDFKGLSKGLKIKDSIEDFMKENSVSESNKIEVMNFILKYGLFEGEVEDFAYIKKLYNMNTIFESFINKFKELDVKGLNLKKFVRYILEQYNNGESETYQSFNLFLNHALNLDDVESGKIYEFSNLISNGEIIEAYKNVDFNIYDETEVANILDIIDFKDKVERELIEQESMEELINRQKINYDQEFISILNNKFKSHNKLISLYLKHGYEFQKDKLFKTYNLIKNDLNINVKLYLYSICKEEKEMRIILRSIDNSYNEITSDFIDIETFNKMLNSGINKEQLIEFMHHAEDIQVKVNGLKYILENENIKINAKELDYSLNIDFFEKISKDGREKNKYKKGLSKKYIELLENKGYAKVFNEEEFSILASFSKRFPQVELL